MLQSMTGFGSAQAEFEGANGPVGVRVEARAVNHRFLQTKVRLPAELSSLEGRVEERVKKALKRGAVNVSVSLTHSTAFQDLGLNSEVAARWASLLKETGEKLGVASGGVDLGLLINLPGVLAGQADERSQEAGGKAILAIVDEALAALVEMRTSEGAALEREFERLAVEIDATRAQIAEKMPGVQTRHHEALKERVNLLLADEANAARVESTDLARELALMADKLDVTEELTRLVAHGEQLGKLLKTGGAVGRKLDFLVQEFHREANTIGSKANDAEVAHLVVDLKASIERLREQVQNIE